VPACEWTDDLQLGYIYKGALNLVPYIYLLYIILFSIDFYILGLSVIASQRIIKENTLNYNFIYK
jgi:hypothetical protein